MKTKTTNENLVNNSNQPQQGDRLEITPKLLYENLVEYFGNKEELIKDIIETHDSDCNPFWNQTPDNVEDYLTQGEIVDFLYQGFFEDVYEYYNKNTLLPYFEKIPNDSKYPEFYTGFNKPSSEWSENEWEIYYEDTVEGDFGSSCLSHICNYFEGNINWLMEKKFEEYIENLRNILISNLKSIDFDYWYTTDDYGNFIPEYSFKFYDDEYDLGNLIIYYEGSEIEWLFEVYDKEQYKTEDKIVGNLNELINELNKLEIHLSQFKQ